MTLLGVCTRLYRFLKDTQYSKTLVGQPYTNIMSFSLFFPLFKAIETRHI